MWTGPGPGIPAWEYPKYLKDGHKQAFREQSRCMSTVLRILDPHHFSVMIHGIIWEEVGCVGAMNSGGYFSMQGSKISKLEACEEDGEGGCNGRVLG